MSEGAISKWQQTVWAAAVAALFAIIGVLVWFVGSTVTELVGILQRQDREPYFLFSGVAIVTLALIRMLSILLGGAIAFAGLAVSFYTHKQASHVAARLGTVEDAPGMRLATYSPGIVAMLIGAAIIVSALYARTTFTSKGSALPAEQGQEAPPVPARIPRPLDELPGPTAVPSPVE